MYDSNGNNIFHYLCDGIYCDINADYEYEQKLLENEELMARHKKEREEEKNKLIDTSLLFIDSECFRNYIFFQKFNDNKDYIVKRYCKYEGLPPDYADVAIQKHVLKDIIISHIRRLNLAISIDEIKSLDGLISEIYSNKKRLNVYSRVGKIQKFIHKLEESNSLSTTHQLNSVIISRLLSLTRLHISLHDASRNDISIIKNELIKNNEEIDKLGDAIPIYVYKNKKKFIESWKRRHLKSLFHFLPEDIRQKLLKILKLKQPFSCNQIIDIVMG